MLKLSGEVVVPFYFVFEITKVIFRVLEYWLLSFEFLGLALIFASVFVVAA